MSSRYCSKKLPKGFSKGKIKIRGQILLLATWVRPILKPAGRFDLYQGSVPLKYLQESSEFIYPTLPLSTSWFISIRHLCRTMCSRMGKLKPGVVAHTCNPSYSRDRDRRVTVQGQPAGRVSGTLSWKQAKHACGSSYLGGKIGGF
jgi:hypothetical protein